MATQPPRMRTREEQRRLSIRTLAIASAASAAAAVVTSQFWVQGTWAAAAMTPVIVAVVSELLHKPTEAVARRITTDRTAVQPPVGEDLPGPAEPRPGPEPRPVTVYGSRGGRSRRRKFALGFVAATAALGFVIGGIALTVPELILGRSITRGGRDTTLVPTKKKKKAEEKAPQSEQTAPTETQTEPQTTPTETQPERTTPTQTQPQRTTPAKPPGGQQPGEPAP